MALPTSGALSLNAIHIEAGGSSGTQASLNDADIRNLIGKGSGVQMSFSEWYGASASTPNGSSITCGSYSTPENMPPLIKVMPIVLPVLEVQSDLIPIEHLQLMEKLLI